MPKEKKQKSKENITSSDDSSEEEKSEQEKEDTVSDMLEKFMIQDEAMKIEEDMTMREKIRTERCLTTLVKFITEPFSTPVSNKMGNKYNSDKYNGLILDIMHLYSVEDGLRGKQGKAPANVYNPKRHNSYYFRSQAAALMVTNIRNYKFIAKNSHPFLELFCIFFQFYIIFFEFFMGIR